LTILINKVLHNLKIMYNSFTGKNNQ